MVDPDRMNENVESGAPTPEEQPTIVQPTPPAQPANPEAKKRNTFIAGTLVAVVVSFFAGYQIGDNDNGSAASQRFGPGGQQGFGQGGPPGNWDGQNGPGGQGGMQGGPPPGMQGQGPDGQQGGSPPSTDGQKDGGDGNDGTSLQQSAPQTGAS